MNESNKREERKEQCRSIHHISGPVMLCFTLFSSNPYLGTNLNIYTYTRVLSLHAMNHPHPRCSCPDRPGLPRSDRDDPSSPDGDGSSRRPSFATAHGGRRRRSCSTSSSSSSSFSVRRKECRRFISASVACGLCDDDASCCRGCL